MSEAREAGAAKHPGQSGHLGQLRFLVQFYILQKKKNYVFMQSPSSRAIKENMDFLKVELYFNEAC